MSALFFDTSAVVKRYLQEVGSSWVRATTNPLAGGIIVIADLATVELLSLLARRVREGTLPASSATQLGNTFLLHSAQEYLTLEMGNTVLEAARLLVGRHPLRTLDALQLASAQRAVARTYHLRQQRSEPAQRGRGGGFCGGRSSPPSLKHAAAGLRCQALDARPASEAPSAEHDTVILGTPLTARSVES